MQPVAILDYLAFQHEQEFNVRMQMSREQGAGLKADQLHSSAICFPQVLHLHPLGKLR
jgi:hypothetical protein